MKTSGYELELLGLKFGGLRGGMGVGVQRA